MQLRTRGRWGVQAGLMAGMAVAAFFFAADLARGIPLATPMQLSRSVLEWVAPALAGTDELEAVLAWSLGARLAWFTALHLAAFTILGVFAAALSNLFPIRWNGRSGSIIGIVLGAVAWVMALRAGPAWIAETHLNPEVVVGAGIVAGVVLGWHLRLCRLDAEEKA